MKRLLCLALVLVTSAAWADKTTLEKYKQAGSALVAGMQSFGTYEIMALSRGRAKEAYRLFAESVRLVGEATAEKDLTDEEKAEIVFTVAEPAGAFVERLTDAFVDAKWEYRPLGDLVQQYGYFGGTVRRVRDFFVRREVEPFRVRNRERTGNVWADTALWPFAVGRALFDRVARLIPSGLRMLNQWNPVQNFEGRWVFMAPPALPYFGADYARARLSADVGKLLNANLVEAMKPETGDWALAGLKPIVDHVMHAEPVRLQWTNRSIRRWFFFMALYLAQGPVEFFSLDSGAENPAIDLGGRSEMGAFEWSLIEVPFMLYLAHMRRVGTGINMYWSLEDSLRKLGMPLAKDANWAVKMRQFYGAGLEKDAAAADKMTRCGALLAASGYKAETERTVRHAGARAARTGR